MTTTHSQKSHLALFLLIWLLGILTATAATAQEMSYDSETAAIAGRIEELTNQARARNGLPPVQRVEYLAKAAQGHSEEMLTFGYFSHTSPILGRATPKQRIVLAGGWDTQTGENIYRSSGLSAADVAERTVAAWLASPGHYKNIMNRAYNSVGVGVARSGSSFSITQDFSKQSIAVEQSSLTPSGSNLQMVLQGRVREGSGYGAVFVNGIANGTFQAGHNGAFEARVVAPIGSVISFGQLKAERSYSITLLLPPLRSPN